MANARLCSGVINVVTAGLGSVFSLLKDIRQCCSDFKHAQPRCMNFLEILNTVTNELEKQNQYVIRDNGLLDRYTSLVARFHESVSNCAAEKNVVFKVWKMYKVTDELPGYYDELRVITSQMSAVTFGISLNLQDRLETDIQAITELLIDQLQTTNELCGAVENIRNRGDSLEELAQKMKRDLKAADDQTVSPALLHALKKMVTDIEMRLGDADLGTPPKWMIESDEILLRKKLICDDEGQQIHIREWQNSEVAVKVFDMALSNKVFINSLTVWRDLHHLHIATLYGAGLMKDGNPFYVYDYALHQSLDRCIDKWTGYRW